jgi:hypothetical protein
MAQPYMKKDDDDSESKLVPFPPKLNPYLALPTSACLFSLGYIII